MALQVPQRLASRTTTVRRATSDVVAFARPHVQAATQSWAEWARGTRRRPAAEPLERYQDELRRVAGNDRRREIARLSNLASAYRRRGELAEAQVCATRAVDVARDVGDERLVGLTLNGLGLVQARHPVPDHAIVPFTEAREIFRRLGDRQIEGQVLANLGGVYAALGDRQAARAVRAEALGALATDSSAYEKLAAWLAAHPDADPAEDETAERLSPEAAEPDSVSRSAAAV
jgi:tetratricopeptide (TPR) repeat protein